MRAHSYRMTACSPTTICPPKWTRLLSKSLGRRRDGQFTVFLQRSLVFRAVAVFIYFFFFLHPSLPPSLLSVFKWVKCVHFLVPLSTYLSAPASTNHLPSIQKYLLNLQSTHKINAFMNEDHEEGCARVDMLICIFTYSFILTGSQCLGTIDRASDTCHVYH